MVFGAAWVLQSLANGHLMLFGAILIVIWIATILAALASLSTLDVVIDRELDPGGRWESFVKQSAGAELLASEGPRVAYRIPRVAPEQRRHGAPWPIR